MRARAQARFTVRRSCAPHARTSVTAGWSNRLTRMCAVFPPFGHVGSAGDFPLAAGRVREAITDLQLHRKQPRWCGRRRLLRGRQRQLPIGIGLARFVGAGPSHPVRPCHLPFGPRGSTVSGRQIGDPIVTRRFSASHWT